MTRLYTNSFLLALILLTFTTYGQTKNKKTERDTTKQWEIGLDLLWLIDKNQIPATNIQIKKYIKQNLTLRSRVGIQYDQGDSTQSTFPGPPNTNNSVALFLRSGFEYQQMITDKITFYYGIDFGIWYENNTTHTTLYIPDFLSYGRYEKTHKMWQLELLPFVGIRYDITKNLNISIESSLNIFYQNSKYSSTGTSLPNYPDFLVFPSEQESNKFGVKLLPFQYINLNYRF
jgi:hypothetical protein